MQADLLEEDEEGSLEYAGESSSMGSFDTLASTNKERIAGRKQPGVRRGVQHHGQL